MRAPIRHVKNNLVRTHEQLSEARSLGYHDLRDLPPELWAQLQQVANQLLSDLAPLLTDHPPSPAEAYAEKLAGRPRWRDRDRSLNQTAWNFFCTHYPDAAALQLPWVAVTAHDLPLCLALRKYQERNPEIGIPLLTKTQVSVARYRAMRNGETTMSTHELAKVTRAVTRRLRKKSKVEDPAPA